MDGIDAVLVGFRAAQVRIVQLLHAHVGRIPTILREQALPLIAAATPTWSIDNRLEGRRTARYRDWRSVCRRDALQLVRAAMCTPMTQFARSAATARHCVISRCGDHPFTLQIGNPATIAAGHRHRHVADFRARHRRGWPGSTAGAAVSRWLFRGAASEHRVINIGGIANITWAAGRCETVVGFDTGPRQHADGSLGRAPSWKRRSIEMATGPQRDPAWRSCSSDSCCDPNSSAKRTAEEHRARGLQSRLAGHSITTEHLKRSADVQATLVRTDRAHDCGQRDTSTLRHRSAVCLRWRRAQRGPAAPPGAQPDGH